MKHLTFSNKNWFQALLLLSFADTQKPFFISVDASGTAVGYILGQKDSEGREVVISYGGCALRGTELKWNICERECLAVVEAIKHLSSIHFTQPFYNLFWQYCFEMASEN